MHKSDIELKKKKGQSLKGFFNNYKMKMLCDKKRWHNLQHTARRERPLTATRHVCLSVWAGRSQRKLWLIWWTRRQGNQKQPTGSNWKVRQANFKMAETGRKTPKANTRNARWYYTRKGVVTRTGSLHWQQNSDRGCRQITSFQHLKLHKINWLI